MGCCHSTKAKSNMPQAPTPAEEEAKRTQQIIAERQKYMGTNNEPIETG